MAAARRNQERETQRVVCVCVWGGGGGWRNRPRRRVHYAYGLVRTRTDLPTVMTRTYGKCAAAAISAVAFVTLSCDPGEDGKPARGGKWSGGK